MSAPRDILTPLQRALEAQNGLSAAPNVTEFLLTREERERLSTSQLFEQVFVIDEPGAPQMGVFIDPDVLQKIALTPVTLQDTPTLDAYCIAAEGVSHFVYLAERADKERSVTLLELELQAEVDKFFHLAKKLALKPIEERRLFEQLFERYSLRDDLDAESVARYHTASQAAAKFCYRLLDSPSESRALITQQFYSLSLEQKLRCVR